MKRTHIELFAGCGGMALGMEAANFHLYFANELSPMASETFAYNLFNEDLRHCSNLSITPRHSLWISSKYSQEDLLNRLRENPFLKSNRIHSDLFGLATLKNKLLIGDIKELLSWIERNKQIQEQLQAQNIDVLSGGPPCQGFSMAGLREKDNIKNSLPWSFAEMASLIKPKVVLLENVEGITKPFNKNGKSYTAWLEVSKAFCIKGFVPICMLLNSKYFGVPQNRPRFIMLGFRSDIFEKILDEERDLLKVALLNESYNFYNRIRNSKSPIIDDERFTYYDIEKWKGLFDGDLFPKVRTDYKNFISSRNAIDDIRDAKKSYLNYNESSSYLKTLNKHFKRPEWLEKKKLTNHEGRNHSEVVVNRFRFYQVVGRLNNGVKAAAFKMISGQEVADHMISEVLNELIRFKFRNQKGKLEQFGSTEKLRDYIAQHQTSKHSQRAILDKEPAPAHLTIPDDICHYSQTRTLTVREMARFQSFPDWFEFKSKTTTGGVMRRYEVPQYTQVGNAVPPLLALELGRTIKKTLNKIGS